MIETADNEYHNRQTESKNQRHISVLFTTFLSIVNRKVHKHSAECSEDKLTCNAVAGLYIHRNSSLVTETIRKACLLKQYCSESCTGYASGKRYKRFKDIPRRIFRDISYFSCIHGKTSLDYGKESEAEKETAHYLMGSHDGGTYDTIRELEPNATVVMNGLPVEMKTAETGAAKQVEKWLKSLNI